MMKARALGYVLPKQFGETDVFNLRVDGHTVLAEVRALVGKGISYSLAFPHHHALFAVDEGDLSRYWVKGQFDCDHFLYEIDDGGLLWQERQAPGILAVSSALPDIREWFVLTSGVCVTVLSTTEPVVRAREA